MVGSLDSVAQSNVVLNTIVAEAFSEACDVLEKAENFELAVHDLIKTYATEHERIVFSGDGYSAEWKEEALRRGLPNLTCMVDAIPAYVAQDSVDTFEKFNVFSKSELESRVEIEYEIYAKTLNIEAKAMIDIATKQIIPAVIRYTTVLADSYNAVKAACPDVPVNVQAELLRETSVLLSETKAALTKLQEVTEIAAQMKRGEAQARYYRDEVNVAMEALRTPVDKLEMIVDKSMWPMPSYGDLIFEV
jgi:glutamine synthetase